MTLAHLNDGKIISETEQVQVPVHTLSNRQALVYVGGIRRVLSADEEKYRRSLTLFCCADQIRKGVATNAVQIAELVIND